MSSKSKRMLPTRSVCERYNITERTVDRWLENGILPTPVRINGLRYWPERELEQREREFQRDYEKTNEPESVAAKESIALNKRFRVRGTGSRSRP